MDLQKRKLPKEKCRGYEKNVDKKQQSGDRKATVRECIRRFGMWSHYASRARPVDFGEQLRSLRSALEGVSIRDQAPCLKCLMIP